VPDDDGVPGPEPGGLFDILLPDRPLTDVLRRVAELATRSVGPQAFAGITMKQEGALATPVYTDERAPRVDQVQYASSGPCVEAYESGELRVIGDTTADERWQEFCVAAVAEGIRSVLSVPMDVSGARAEVLGALNLYSEQPRAFDDDAAASTRSFAQQAAIVVANARAYWGAKELADQLQNALESRAVIEQAKGILMAREGISADRAFDVLVRASQRENRKLRDIAGELVERNEGGAHR
jgi:GAF domain-containing protein